jgi:hypothetical protein
MDIEDSLTSRNLWMKSGVHIWESAFPVADTLFFSFDCQMYPTIPILLRYEDYVYVLPDCQAPIDRRWGLVYFRRDSVR